MKRILLIILATTSLLANAQVGTQTQIGPDGAWLNATAACTLNDLLFTTEKNGTLVQTNLLTGMRKTIGKSGFDNNRFLFTSDKKLYMLDFAGTLSEINVTTGTKEKIGIATSFAGIYACTAIDGTFFGVDTKGSLITADLATGDKQANGNGSYINTAFLFLANERIYCLEQSGSLFEWAINGGTKHQLGKMGDYAATTAGVGYNGGLYLVNKSGILSFVNTTATANERTKIGKPIFNLTKFIFGANGKLYTIESMGSLYEVGVK